MWLEKWSWTIKRLGVSEVENLHAARGRNLKHMDIYKAVFILAIKITRKLSAFCIKQMVD